MGEWSSAWRRRLSSYLREHRPRSWWHAVGVAIAYVMGWAVIAVPVAYYAFMTADQPTVVAGHDVVVSPTRDGWATINLGAFLPDVRYPTDSTFGVTIDVGATNAENYNTLIQRYAVIASQPDAEVGKVEDIVRHLAYRAILIGALTGLSGPLLWVLIGRRRRRELVHSVTPRRAVAGVAGVAAVVGLLVWQPLGHIRPSAPVAGSSDWQPIGTFITETPVTGPAARLQIQGGLISRGSKTLISGAFDTYRRSLTFYADLADRAKDLSVALRRPSKDETVALVVSDRHDNVGMDAVARAIGDAGGATVLLDAGDDTSTGESWEAFSLDSLSKAFDGYERYGVAGNHDNGSFVADYLSDRGFTMLAGEPVKAVDGIRLMGAPDPRSSNLSSGVRAPSGTFDEQAAILADAACAADADGDRVTTLLVHDANLGAPALERGCVDLVLSGHLHIQAGPTQVTGENGVTGTTYTNGTTGGAAYAFALGSKIRRDAEVTLVTYREGRPVGLQPVTIRTTGEFVVSDYLELSTAGADRGNRGN
jgi:predicted phosphodiesterase